VLYKTIIRERASKEYLEAIEWYEKRSLQAVENFILIVQQTLNEIEDRPDHFRIVYKNYREAKTKRYPYSIVYFIDEKKQSVIITTLFHHKRNPKKKFK
jgi:plasmid stabilization system protein ParE